MSHRNTLRFQRRKRALSQTDLAHLIGTKARSVISSYEAGARFPQLRAALAYAFVFGVSLDELFPNITQEIEDQVMRRAATLDAKVRGRAGASAAAARRLLQEMVSRAHNADEA